MFTKFNKKIKTIFLDPQSSNDSISDGEKVNIILSPSLYWVKKVSLPVKHVRDAKKLLRSIFEDSLPIGNYSYEAYKSGDSFYIFAYEDKLILDTLQGIGISLSDIVNVHFSQSEMQDIEGAVKINETQSIYVKDDIVVLLPCCWIEESGKLSIEDIALSEHRVALQQYGHIVDNSSLFKIGAVLFVLFILISGEYLITLHKIAQIEESKNELFIKYKLKSTMLQNSSMLKKYKNIHLRQNHLRDYISLILSFKLQGDEELLKLTLRETKLSADFKGMTQNSVSRMKNSLQSKNIEHTIDLKDGIMHLELRL
ncbi:MAG: hypothetical protein U9N33_04690 [Campylobacterota bacterium]|nr:hypothetical protein [Campylobacterota bacterium]